MIESNASHDPSEHPETQDIQIFLIEDDEQVRVHLREALRSQSGIDIYSEATNAETGLVLLQSVRGGDIALIDMSLPDKPTLELIQAFRQVQKFSENPDLKICVLLDPDGQPHDEHVTIVGEEVEGYCLKTAPVEQLSEMIRVIHAGHVYAGKRLAGENSKGEWL